MTLEKFLDRIDEIMCGTSNAERAYLEELYDEISLTNRINWEQRRYEIAKALLPIAYNLYFSNKDFEKTVEGGIDEEHPEFLQVINEYVLEQTDELIKQLKGGEE